MRFFNYAIASQVIASLNELKQIFISAQTVQFDLQLHLRWIDRFLVIVGENTEFRRHSLFKNRDLKGEIILLQKPPAMRTPGLLLLVFSVFIMSMPMMIAGCAGRDCIKKDCGEQKKD